MQGGIAMELRKDRDLESTRNDRVDPGVAFAAVHTKSLESTIRHDEEKLSLFWRVFGGTILSICALISVTVYNNMAANISELRTEINRINEARGELIKKDEFNTRLATAYDRVQNLQGQNNSQNASLTSLQTTVNELKDRLTASKTESDIARKEMLAAADATKKEQSTALDAIKKEQATINDGLKKELTAIEGLKERIAVAEGMKKELDAIRKELGSLEAMKDKLAMTAAEVKDHRDDLSKIRQEVERNLAGDAERKKNRDDQYAKLLDAM